MIKKEELYEQLRSRGHNQFILNKLNKVDAEYNYERYSELDVFKTSSNIQVNFNEFALKIAKVGIEFKNHAEQNNLSEHITKLAIHLKENSEFKIEYEQLDSDVIDSLNQISNDYLKEFHRDNFIEFKDFGIFLTKEGMVKNYEMTKIIGNETGYELK